MRLHRFYLDQKIERGREIRIDNQNLLHQWMKVFRYSSGDRVIIFNGDGFEFESVFKILSRNEAVVIPEYSRKIKGVTKVELHLFPAIIKKDNFEFVVEKCTELGVKAFHPIISDRSEKKDLNMERLKKISMEASEQSGRADLPLIFELTDIETALKSFDGKVFALDFVKQKFPSKVGSKKIGILIGPEGGWSEREISLFKKLGIKSFSLGDRVLRAETASIAIGSLILLK